MKRQSRGCTLLLLLLCGLPQWLLLQPFCWEGYLPLFIRPSQSNSYVFHFIYLFIYLHFSLEVRAHFINLRQHLWSTYYVLYCGGLCIQWWIKQAWWKVNKEWIDFNSNQLQKLAAIHRFFFVLSPLLPYLRSDRPFYFHIYHQNFLLIGLSGFNSLPSHLFLTQKWNSFPKQETATPPFHSSYPQLPPQSNKNIIRQSSSSTTVWQIFLLSWGQHSLTLQLWLCYSQSLAYDTPCLQQATSFPS